MTTRTREEVLQLVNTYRGKVGPNKAGKFPISDDWGAIETLAGLLIQDPKTWQNPRHLTDKMIDDVYKVILGWLEKV